MEVSNITLVAYIDTLKENRLDPSILTKGTSLDYKYIQNRKEKINWKEFETITNNTFNILGEERALESLRKTGMQNDGLTIFKRIGSGILRIEDSYRFFCSFVAKHFYKNLTFSYKKICKGHIQITIKMNDGSRCFDNFVKAYACAFQSFPSEIGLKPAKTSIDNTGADPVINIFFKDSLKLWNPILFARRVFNSLQSTTSLLNEIEDKNEEYAILNQKLEILNSELVNSNKLNETLIKAIMHDLNNPLTIVRIKNEKLNHDSARFNEKDRAMLSRGIDNMQNVIQDLKKIFNEKDFSIDEAFDLVEAVHEIESIFFEALNKKNIALTVTSSLPPQTLLYGSRITFINSIIANIVSNAIKFSFEGGTISITLTQDIDNITITIKDSGVGMNESTINCFNNGEACNSQTGTIGEMGQGIGLTQATYFTNKMKGELIVSSKLKSESDGNHGTEFKLIFNKRKQSSPLQ